MSGWLRNKLSTAAAVVTGMGMQPVLFDAEKGMLVVKVQVAGAANFQAIGPDGPGLKKDYDDKYRNRVTSMAGYAGQKVAASGAAAGRYGASVGRALAGYSGGRSRRNRRNRRDPTRRNRRN